MAADGREADPAFTLAELHEAARLGWLRGQAHRDDDRLPEYPPEDALVAIVIELAQARRA